MGFVRLYGECCNMIFNSDKHLNRRRCFGSKIFFFFWQAFEESKGKFQQRFGKNYCGHLTINHYEEERDAGRGGKWVPIFSRTFKYEFISFNFQFFYLLVNALILGSQFLTFY